MATEREIAELAERTRQLERRIDRLEGHEIPGALQLMNEKISVMAKEVGSVKNINVWMLRSFVGTILTLLVGMGIFLVTSQGGP